MKKRNIIILLAVLFTSFFPLSGASATILTDNLFTSSSAYYVFDLEKNDILIANLTSSPSGSGQFSMYLLNSRPITDNLAADNIIAEGLNMFYNATSKMLYYLHIFLSDNGPDTFYLNITKNGEDLNLIRYYIPQIPGFPLEILILMLFGGIGLTYFIWKRKMNIEQYDE